MNRKIKNYWKAAFELADKLKEMTGCDKYQYGHEVTIDEQLNETAYTVFTYYKEGRLLSELRLKRYESWPGSGRLRIIPKVKLHTGLINKDGGINVARHNYPKTRKPRNTDYAKSNRLITSIGVETLNELFLLTGMYNASRQISQIAGEEVTPWVTRYIRTKLKTGGYINETEQ